jgi:hypothetical protein
MHTCNIILPDHSILYQLLTAHQCTGPCLPVETRLEGTGGVVAWGRGGRRGGFVGIG